MVHSHSSLMLHTASRRLLTPDTEFARPLVPPSIPNTVEHIGPEKKKNYLLWTEMVNDDFVAWWLKTEFGSQLK
jgi:hypothetical protein